MAEMPYLCFLLSKFHSVLQKFVIDSENLTEIIMHEKNDISDSIILSKTKAVVYYEINRHYQ